MKDIFKKHLGVILVIVVVIILVVAVASSSDNTKADTADVLPAPTNLTIEQ